MKRRTFLKILGLAPAVVAVPVVAKKPDDVMIAARRVGKTRITAKEMWPWETYSKPVYEVRVDGVANDRVKAMAESIRKTREQMAADVYGYMKEQMEDDVFGLTRRSPD